MSDEFLINSYAGQWQEHPDVTRLADGSVVVVWDSFFFEDDLETYYIAMQRFSASGKPMGGEQVLAAFTDGQSRHPSVAALADGGFAVAWEIAVGDSVLDQTDIYTNTFNANGTARGSATRAHSASGEDQYAASITATAGGGFTLTWSSYEGPKTNNQDEIFTRRFDADGRAIGQAQQVNTFDRFDQHNSRATTLSNGNVLLTWESEYAGNPNPSGVNSDGVRARLYTAGGKTLSREFLLIGENDGMNSGIGLTSSSVDVAALPDARFVATWYETVLHDQRDTTFEIHAQIYANNGDRLGKELLVRGGSESVPAHTAVTALEGGGFVVAWDAFGKRSGAFEEVFARVYDDDGRATGKAFVVNPPSGGSAQENPELVALDDGSFMVVYESEYLDGDDDAIAGRIFKQGSQGADIETMGHAGTYRGLGGADAITGTAGADALYGGRGADRIAGGEGADLFVYRTAAASHAHAADAILDFASGEDRIDLSHVAAFAWVGAAAFSGTANELRYADGLLAADLDGDAAADFAIAVGPLVQADLIL